MLQGSEQVVVGWREVRALGRVGHRSPPKLLQEFASDLRRVRSGVVVEERDFMTPRALFSSDNGPISAWKFREPSAQLSRLSRNLQRFPEKNGIFFKWVRNYGTT